MSENVTSTCTNGVLTLTLGGGKAHPLSRAMIAALHSAISAAQHDTLVRVIVIDGPGSIFCAGHDLKEIARHRADADKGRAYLTDLFDSCAALMLEITNSSRPVIAQVEGIATASGLQLVAACDLAIAADSARFCLPGITRGGFCTTPGVAVARAVSRKHLMELLLSGENRGAVWALNAGLVNEVVAPDALASRVAEVATQLAARITPVSQAGIAATKAHLDLSLADAYALATREMIEHFMDDRLQAQDKTSRFAAG